MKPLLSALALRILSASATQAGFDVRPVLRRLGLNLETLDLSSRVPWERCLRLMEALCDGMGRERFLSSGELFPQSVPDYAATARTFVRPLALMRFTYQVVDPVVFPMIRFEVEALDERRFLLGFTLDAQYEPSDLFWAYCSRADRSMPRYLGLPAAKVDAEYRGHHYRAQVEWPEFEAHRPAPAQDCSDSALRFLQGIGLDVIRLLSGGYEELVQLGEQQRHLRGAVSELLAEIPNAAFFVREGAEVVGANEAGTRWLRRGAEAAATLSSTTAEARGQAVVPLLADEELIILAHPEEPGADLGTALELLPAPVAVIGPRAELLACNQRFRGLLSEHNDLREERGVLRVGTGAADRAWQEGVGRVLNPVQPPQLPLLHDIQAMDSPAITLLLQPLPGGATPRGLVVVHAPAAGPRLDAALIGRLFALTPAEAEVAVAIAEGAQPEAIAGARSCSVDTVRTHLKRIFEKTGTHTQAGLVRLLLSSTALHLVQHPSPTSAAWPAANEPPTRASG